MNDDDDVYTIRVQDKRTAEALKRSLAPRSVRKFSPITLEAIKSSKSTLDPIAARALKALMKAKPYTDMGKRLSGTNAAKGREGAAARWTKREGYAEVDRIIRVLAGRRDYALGDYLPPRELWTELYSEMEAAGLDPVDRGDHYIYAESEKLTYSAFCRRIQRAHK